MREQPPSVRIATPADIPALFWSCYGAYLDNPFPLPFSPPRVLSAIVDCASGHTGIAGIIDGPNGETSCIGSIGINLTQPIYTSDWILCEAWLFVHPAYRAGTHHYQALFDFALWHREDMARQVKQEFLPLELNVYSLKRLDAKTRLWRKNALHVGSMFWAGVQI